MKKTMFFIWFIILGIPLSYTMGMHSLSLKSSKNEKLTELVTPTQKWTKLHFLGSDCACSETVYKELLKRTPDKDNEEKIYIIGNNPKWFNDLKAKGYEVASAPMDEFEKKYTIQAVPQLIVLNDQKKILYSGGYSAHRNPSSIEDEFIVESLKGHKKTQERPIFGCISGSLNRKQADPFSFKY